MKTIPERKQDGEWGRRYERDPVTGKWVMRRVRRLAGVGRDGQAFSGPDMIDERIPEDFDDG